MTVWMWLMYLMLVWLHGPITCRHGMAKAYPCIFDDIQPKTVPQRQTRYKLKSSSSPHRRISRSDHAIYQPIRLNYQFYDLDEELSSTEQQLLKSIVGKAVERITTVLSVIPMSDPLLLARSTDACSNTWTSGINEGKCASMKQSYRGEICLDNFKIPDDHLEGVYLWNVTHPEPYRVVYTDGQGIAHADYVLYIRALTTKLCISSGANVVAYAAYCQLDQNHRPIAGYINICPAMLRDVLYTQEKSILITLHELLHALGFSSDLFAKFKECTVSGTGEHGPVVNCSDRRKPVRHASGSFRLVTPRVVQTTSAHFGCVSQESVNEFGAILEAKDGQYQSHWDAAFMQGSLMTPSVGLPHLTALDTITLSAFEDSGWYKVKFQKADKFMWGMGGGCDFGLYPKCLTETRFFCTGSGSGCHSLHYDKATCSTDPSLHRCSIYKSTEQSQSCQSGIGGTEQKVDLTGERYNEKSRCFMGNLTVEDSLLTMETGGYCYEHECLGPNQLMVRVGDSAWMPCPAGKYIQVQNYTGLLQCPLAGVLCTESAFTPTTAQPKTTTPRKNPQLLDIANTSVRHVEITFMGIDYVTLNNNKQVKKLIDVVIRQLVHVTGVSRSRITDPMIHPTSEDSSLLFSFDLLPSTGSNDGPTTDSLLTLLKKEVLDGDFKVELTQNGPVYRASEVRLRDSPEMSFKQVNRGVIAGVVVASVFAAFVMAVLVFFVQRFHALRSSHQRPNHVAPIHNGQRRARSGGNNQHLASIPSSEISNEIDAYRTSNHTELSAESRQLAAGPRSIVSSGEVVLDTPTSLDTMI